MSQKILIVDDDEKLRNLVMEYLEGYGFRVETMPDGTGVVEVVQKTTPDIIILDIMMPSRNGLDVLRDIRAESNVPVIMLTAKGEDADRIVGLELGADDYVSKPFNPRELLARMKAVMRRSPPEQPGDPHGTKTGSETMLRQLRAIMSADVKGYSRLMALDEMGTIQTLNTYRELIGVHVQQFSGRVVDSPGDNMLAEFGSVVSAVECAFEIQKTLWTKNADLPPEAKMEYRIGVNLGDVVLEKGRIYGDGVNIAARIEKLAEPGGIAISGTVYDQVASRLKYAFQDIGEKQMKNIARPIRVYRIDPNG